MTLFDFEENLTDEDRDVTKRKDVKINDTDFILRRKDPYGLWYIQPANGITPKDLDGQYTSQDECEKKIVAYLGQAPSKKTPKNTPKE